MLIEPQTEKLNRTAEYRKRILESPYELCIERARYYTQVYKETEGEHPSIRAAKALAKTLDKMTTYILPEELLVGNRASKAVATVIPIERGDINVVINIDLDNLLKRKDRPFHLSPEDKEELMNDIMPYWKTRTVRYFKEKEWEKEDLLLNPKFGLIGIFERIRNFGFTGLLKTVFPLLNGRVRKIGQGMKEIALNNPNLVNNVFDVQGHLILGHNFIIKTGFKGIREKASKDLKKYPEDSDQAKFLESVIITCDAVKRYAKRFEDLANKSATDETEPVRKQEFVRIAENMAKVPWNTPENFYEAVQFVWFTQAISIISHGIAGIFSVGRPDQFLYPFYKKDIEEGIITREFALSLVEELLIKLSCNLLILPSYGKMTASELGGDNNATAVGGVDKKGEDATNDLSYIFMDAIINIKCMTNSFSMRVHSKSPDEYLMKIAEVYSHTSGPAIFNDEIIIPALVKAGDSLEDARDYSIIGCVEPTSAGNTFACTSGNDISLVGLLEMVLNDGKIRMMGKPTGVRTGKLEDFQSFDEILDAYKAQIKHAVEFIAKCVDLKDKVYMEHFHNPFVSITLDGCLDNATDMTMGGAKYNYSSISGRGLSTVADSLLAIKKAVFEEKILTLKELSKMLKSNFRGKKIIRQRLINKIPKFGNDNEEADEMASWVANAFCDEVYKQNSIRGGVFRPGFFSYGMNVMDGSFLGATPNGRRAGEPVSNSMSPSNGSEKMGPTATIKSSSKICHEKISNGSSLNMKLNPSLLQSDAGKKKFVAMLKTFIDLKNMHVQFNVINDEMLREAQIHPEEHMDLVIRVSGYSAYFTDLGKPVQNDIIKRVQFCNL